MLTEQIAALKEMLDDKEFLTASPESEIENHRHQLSEMQTEHDAIEKILKKLG